VACTGGQPAALLSLRRLQRNSGHLRRGGVDVPGHRDWHHCSREYILRWPIWWTGVGRAHFWSGALHLGLAYAEAGAAHKLARPIPANGNL